MSDLGFNVPPTMRSYGDGIQFKVSSERSEKRGIDLAIPRLVVYSVSLLKTVNLFFKEWTSLWKVMLF